MLWKQSTEYSEKTHFPITWMGNSACFIDAYSPATKSLAANPSTSSFFPIPPSPVINLNSLAADMNPFMLKRSSSSPLGMSASQPPMQMPSVG